MKKFLILASTIAFSTSAYAADEFQEFKVDPNLKLPTASKKAHETWKNERFGMFIHWGPISQLGKQLGHGRNSPSHRTGGKPYKKAAMPAEVYDAQYKTFNPTKFDPDAMLKLAKSAGVSYIVFTAKHHAGFSMFDSAVTDYDMMSTPYKKDITKMLSDAAKKNEINFGFYYSPRDWRHPDCDSDNHHDRYITFYKSQMKELLTHYGPIHEIWFDGMGPGKWGDTSREVMGMIRKLHPDAMVNDRGGAGADFYTPEHNISYFNRDHVWEACHTTTSQWGYNPKTGPKPLKQLMEILLYTWGADGNMLLNIGPMGDGSMNPAEEERFQQLAQWWKTHGETSIRNSRGGPYIPGPWGVATCKENKVYLHIFRWPSQGALQFPALDGLKLVSSKALNGKDVRVTETKDGYSVQMSSSNRERILTTIELTFDAKTIPVKPLQRVASLTKQATLTASHSQDELKNLTDQNASTNWSGKLEKGEKEFWVEAKFEKPVTIACVNIARGDEWSPKHTAEMQVPDGDSDGGWKTITDKRFRLKWETMKFLKTPVTTDRIRLRITKANKFTFAEFELFPPVK